MSKHKALKLYRGSGGKALRRLKLFTTLYRQRYTRVKNPLYHWTGPQSWFGRSGDERAPCRKENPPLHVTQPLVNNFTY
jgi:hypothetical protein